MGSVNERIADEIRRHAISLARYSEHERQSIFRMLNRLFGQLQNDLQDSDITTGRTRYQRRRLELLFKQVRSTIATSYEGIGKRTEAGLKSLAEIEGEWAVSMLNKALGVKFVTMTPATAEQLGAIASDVLIEGAPSSEWWSRQSEKLLNNFKDQVRQGWTRGETLDQLMKRLTGGLDEDGNPYFDLRKGTRRGAEATIRTSVQAVANDARMRVYKDNADIIEGLQWVSTLDMRTTIECAALDGLVWDINGNPIGHGISLDPPPRHWNCLPGDALVSPVGRISSASKRWVEGELVFIKTASNNELSCTPNHPILTSRGWVPASKLNEVGDVISYSVVEGEGRVDGNIKDVPVTIEEIVSAFFGSRSVLSMPMPLTTQDFHGDGGASEIAVVGADRVLWERFNPSLKKHFGKLCLKRGRPSGAIKKACSCHLDGFAALFRNATDSCIRFFRKALSLVKGGSVHSGLLLFRSVADVNAVLSKKPDDNACGYIELFGDTSRSNSIGVEGCNLCKGKTSYELSILSGDSVFGENPDNHFISDTELSSNLRDGSSSVVKVDDGGFVDGAPSGANSFLLDVGGFLIPAFVDKITSYSVGKFSGHVYNLQTESSVYLANNIITHNCRSVLTPITKSFREMGIPLDEFPESTRASMDGQVPEGKTFEQWISGQPEGVAEKVFGKGRAELWRHGKITVRDMVDQRGRPLTLEELREQG